jgi:hypothetical protein
MIQVSAQPVPVNYRLTIIESVKVSAGDPFVAAVGFFCRDALTGVLDDAAPLANGTGGVNSDRMNGRRAND